MWLAALQLVSVPVIATGSGSVEEGLQQHREVAARWVLPTP